MSVTALLGLACIVLGFVGVVIDEQILMPALAWFVAALAFNTLGFGFTIGGKRA